MSKRLKAENVLDKWFEPNNTDVFFADEQDQDALRKAFAFWKTEPSEAFRRFLTFAEQGSIYSMLQISYGFLKGKGTETDKAQGEEWLLRANSLGSEAAMLTLANEYRRQKRYPAAEALLEQPMQRNYPPALYLMGLIYMETSRPKEAKKALVKAKNLGHQWARATLWRQSTLGAFGLPSVFSGIISTVPLMVGIVRTLNEAEADAKEKLWFRREFWKPNNSSEIWENEKNKEILKENYALWKTDAGQAFKNFLKCAEEGSIWSMFQVGWALLNGQGTNFDPPRAEMWLGRADAAGYEVATFTLAWEYRRQKRYSDAEAVLKASVEKNVRPALFLTGLICIDTERRREAERMLKRAAALGDQVARSELKDRYFSGYFGFTARALGIPLLVSEWKDARKKLKSSKNQVVKKEPEVDPEWG